VAGNCMTEQIQRSLVHRHHPAHPQRTIHAGARAPLIVFPMHELFDAELKEIRPHHRGERQRLYREEMIKRVTM